MTSTVPAKSNNPLHNFDLPYLKWKKNQHSNNHQRRRSNKLSSDSSSPSPQRHSPMRESMAAAAAAARQSPMRDSVARQSPMREPIPGFRQSPMRESSSPMRDLVVANHRSPMRDSVVASRRSPMSDSVVASRRSTIHDSNAAASRRSPMSEFVAAARQSPISESITAFRQSSMRDSVPPRQSPMRESVPPRQSPMHCESVPESDKDTSVVKYRRHSRISAPESTKKGICEKSDKKHKVLEVDAAGSKEGRSKILLKIPRKNHEEHRGDESQEVTAEEEAAEDTAPKTWNLRPRKAVQKSSNLNGGPFRASGSAIQENKFQSPHMNVNKPENNESNPPKKEKRPRFSIALSREEIDEDIYAMTGSKATRKPKKRVKNVQKQLDTLFPGLWLTSITPDLYKVCENVPKG
ncbi:serine/arginine repetitive matrix protein 1 [Solanum pennellii]|uniref:Serine/arginine repetitive matrix protein 1 n=1 Tax=Solanum pennellii TaxID=28526 RepID=A0ABM1FFU7_SOLPN|nr:serine/arginine repetitive matrix protein 1 [Solanum pennellii]